MRLSIEPIEPRHRDSLRRHLAPFGLPAQVVEWKYFRRAPRHEGVLGFVWIRHGEVRGAVGLIPFELQGAGAAGRAAWTCDWVVDAPQSNPGVGVMLMHHARDAVGLLFSLGGNDRNRQLMPRIASACFTDAAIEMHVPLRAGGSAWYRGLDRRLGGALGAFQRVPLRKGRPGDVVFATGVSPLLEPLLEVHRESMSPAYDLTYLRWQIEECPVLQSATCVSRTSDAGALCWSATRNLHDWRFALWTRDDTVDGADMVIRAVVDYVYGRGGQRLSAIVSGRDRARLHLLRAHGFVDSEQSKPLFVTTPHAGAADALAAHSFLDSDLAYRF